MNTDNPKAMTMGHRKSKQKRAKGKKKNLNKKN